MAIGVPIGYISSKLSDGLKCCSIDWCYVCGEVNKQDGPDDKAAWQFKQQVLFGAGLSRSMPGIVNYEFAMIWIDR